MTESDLNEYPVEALRELLERIYELTGIYMSVLNHTGDIMMRLGDQNKFCRESREDENLHALCRDCSHHAVCWAADTGSPVTYRCHRGLIVTAVPVMVEGHAVAFFFFNGYMMYPEDTAAVPFITEPGGYLLSDEELASVEKIHRRRMADLQSLLQVAAKYIGESYRRMKVERALNESRLNVLKETNARLEMQQLHAQAELKALQVQINPHFLFNTLSAISQMATLDGSERTADALYSLAALLRRNMRLGITQTSLMDEIFHIDEYIKIKKYMYRDRIRYVKQIDEKLMNMSMPPFSLQPLVENALIHGIEVLPRGGTVNICVRREDNCIRVDVCDNGAGCDPELLRSAIVEGADPAGSGDTTGLGLHNVFERLKLFYGADFRWEADSVPGKGTRITLFLPADSRFIASEM